MPAIRNGLWNGLANVLGAVTGLVGSIVIVRSLTTEGYGAFSYYIWLAGLIGTLGTLACPNALTKVTSELRGERRSIEARALARWVTIGLFSVNGVVSLGVALWALASPPGDRIYLFVVAAFLAPTAASAAMRSTLWGRERYRSVTVASTIASVGQLVAIIGVALAGLSTPGFLVAVLSTNTIQAVALMMTLKRADFSIGVPLGLSFPCRSTVRRYVAFLIPATLGLPITIIVWERSEVFFLARYSSLDQVGFYNLAYTVFSLTLALGLALVNGFYPAMSKDYGAGEWHRLQTKINHGLHLATIYAVPLTFGGLATIDGLIEILYGNKMLPVAPLVRVLLIGLTPGVIGALLGIVLSATDQIWMGFWLGIVLCSLNVGLDLILIPQYGALGGSIANTSAQVVCSLLLLALVKRIYRVSFPWRSLASIVVVGALTTFVVPSSIEAWLPGIWGLAASIALGAVLYATAVWFGGHLRVFRPVEAVA